MNWWYLLVKTELKQDFLEMDTLAGEIKLTTGIMKMEQVFQKINILMNIIPFVTEKQ